ncbi:MAG: hypothetical protein WDM81_13385 [Rhizomicrobium sp.]
MLRRLFVSVQASKALVGAVLSLAFVSFVGRPDAAEGIAIAGLMAPAVLALLGFTASRSRYWSPSRWRSSRC